MLRSWSQQEEEPGFKAKPWLLERGKKDKILCRDLCPQGFVQEQGIGHITTVLEARPGCLARRV